MQGFLAEQRDAVRGVVGEVAGATYAETFGGSEVERIEVIDLAPGPRTTRVADIGTTGSLPEGTYDCLIVTQVMQYVPDVAASIGNLIRALRPGGTLLLAVPALTPHDARESLDGDYWRFWPAGLAHLLATAAPRSPRSVVGYGNLLATTAFLHGVAAEELKPSELSRQDGRFPVVVCARVDAPPEGPTFGAGL